MAVDPVKIRKAAKRSAAISKIAFFEERARRSNNLVYVWLAIFEADRAGLEMPEWCREQILFWAGEIYELAHGLDPDKGRQLFDNDDEASAELVHARWNAGWRAGGTSEVSPGEALSKAKAIFFPPKRGYNPFDSMRTDLLGLKAQDERQVRDFAPENLRKQLKPLAKRGEGDEGRNHRGRRSRLKSAS